MTELEELITQLVNIKEPLVKASTDLYGLADRYDYNTWLKSQLFGIKIDLNKVINRLNELMKIYDFRSDK